MTNSDIIGPGESTHSVDVAGLPTEALQGILRKLNERSQSVTKLFRKSYAVSTTDIKQIISKIDQEFHSCTRLSRSVSVALILSGNERYDFRTWKEFEEFDTSQSNVTTSLQVEMVYDVIRNDGETPERYSIQISIQNSERGMGFVFVPIMIAEAGKFPVPPSPISTSVTFNNYILGKNLLSTIDGWVDALDTREVWLLEKLQKYSDYISSGVFFLATLASIGVCAGISDLFPIDFRAWLLWSGGIVFTFSFFGRSIGKYVERNIDRIGYSGIIELTRGDISMNRKKAKRNASYILKASIAFVVFIAQLAAGVWADELLPSLERLFGE